MNDTSQTSAPGASLLSDTAGLFTAAHLIIVALFAVLVVIGVVYGMRLKRQRVKADREEQRFIEQDKRADDGAGEMAPPSRPAAERPASPPAPAAPAEPAPTAVEPIAADDPMANQPIPASAPMEGNPAAEIASVDAGPAERPADGPVTQLKGLGPKVAARLGELGVTTVGQIAALSDDQAADLDAQLGSFKGRMQRDRWIEQARFLAAGDRAGFEAVFGKL